MAMLLSFILSALGWDGLNTCALAFDTGWMQKGVRLWYFGGIDSGAPTSSNAEEAYLLDAINNGQVSLTHHSALEYWSSPRPAEIGTYPLLDKGPCWIHPQALQNLKAGDQWMGQQITLVDHSTYTYATFPYHLLPAWALFKLKSQRELVKLSYKIPGFSEGNAYFDAETGILLYHHTLWGAYKMFFILSEINYDFSTGKAFPEDDGPHTGFKAIVSEQSMNFWPKTGGGSVVIQSLVESRYGNTVEMTVLSSLSGPSGAIPQTIENYCFFGDVPIVRRKDAVQAPNLPPENWDPLGEYLWWWIPSQASGKATINILDVLLARTGLASDRLGAPSSIFTATQTPPGFFFSTLWFGGDGYLTQFSAKDAAIGLDIRPGDDVFQNSTTVKGLVYYRNTMGTATPSRPSGFNKVTPANGTAIPPIDLLLSWGISPGAAIYQYCLNKTNNTTCDGNWVTTGSNNAVILSGLDKGATYYWQVRAFNDFGSIDADGGNWWAFAISSNFYLYLPMVLK